MDFEKQPDDFALSFQQVTQDLPPHQVDIPGASTTAPSTTSIYSSSELQLRSVNEDWHETSEK
ncbi:hypothetical protein [Selenomonas massiliensis]|uniref:hypothetical protein n=1 Tax=Selenomonas massiliensis TaxID=2058293 RepID=UPI00131E3B5C|nr:hypothetical protein [Selenomonas massiliensis]